MVTGKEDSGNNYARGKLSIGKEYIDYCIEKINKLAEMSDNL